MPDYQSGTKIGIFICSGEDLNLQYGNAVQQFSKLSLSATQPLLQLYVMGVAGLEPAKTEVA